MNFESLADAKSRIHELSYFQVLPLSAGFSGTARFDRLFLGPGTKQDLERVLTGWPAEAPCYLLDSGAHPVSANDLLGLGANEGLHLPAQPNLVHEGGLAGLKTVVHALLDPETGCPWDLKQTHQSLTKYLIEESYELIEAIERGSMDDMREELGDVLLQPIVHAEMASRRGDFDIEQIAQQQAEKLVRRHPHVFGDVVANDAEQVLKNWDAIKKAEKGTPQETSILDGVPRSMPALSRALSISKRAARTGFEWPNIEAVFGKLREELAELREAMAGKDPAKIEAELGDLLFTVVNIARWLEVDSEAALSKMLQRFTDRFKFMELSTEKPLDSLSAEEFDALWVKAKLSLNG